MNSIDKFVSDVKKIIKHQRADNGGLYNGKIACEKICNLFELNNRSLGNIAHSISGYWLDKYIYNSADFSNEPTETNLNKLISFQLFPEGEKENLDNLTEEDWTTLKEFVNFEAEDLPLDLLQEMMSLILEKGAL
ncbi:MAG: hypothetical protein IJ312_07780 [Treponema sp.]|nr:hypothetical protein [Treponema sp.]